MTSMQVMALKPRTKFIRERTSRKDKRQEERNNLGVKHVISQIPSNT